MTFKWARAIFPVSVLRSQIVPSAEPDTMHLPPGENATELTLPVCPLKILDIPYPNCLVIRTRHDVRTIRRERDRSDFICVPSIYVPLTMLVRQPSCFLSNLRLPTKKGAAYAERPWPYRESRLRRTYLEGDLPRTDKSRGDEREWLH